MKNWNDFNFQEQIEIVVMFIRDKRDDLSLAEQCSLERYLYANGQKSRFNKNAPTLVDIKQLNFCLVQDGFEEWFNDNLSDLQDLVVNDFGKIDYVFWKEGWIVSHDGVNNVIERIDDVVEWKRDNGLGFLPNQLDNDLDAVKLAKKYGFKFDDRAKRNRITNPQF